MTVPITIKLPTLHADQIKAYWEFKKSKRFVLRCGRRYGKTRMLTTIAADYALKGKKVGFFCPEARYTREPFLEVKSILAPLIQTSSKVEGEIRLSINQGQVAFWSLKDNELAARGRDYDLVIFDEHAFNKPNVKDTWKRLSGRRSTIAAAWRSLRPTHAGRMTRIISTSCTSSWRAARKAGALGTHRPQRTRCYRHGCLGRPNSRTLCAGTLPSSRYGARTIPRYFGKNT